MANVLKGHSESEKVEAARDVSGLAGFNLSDLADEGRNRLQECRHQIHQMLQSAREEAEQLRQQAEQRGYQEGLDRAAQDAEQKLQREAESRARESLQLIRHAVQQLHQTHQDWMQQYADSLTTIAIAAAERIVTRRLQDEPDLIVQWADEALRSTRSATSLTLAVHPETLAQLGSALDQLLASADLPEQTHVQPDETLGPGDVVVRQNGGEIQAGLRAQLERLEELLS